MNLDVYICLVESFNSDACDFVRSWESTVAVFFDTYAYFNTLDPVVLWTFFFD